MNNILPFKREFWPEEAKKEINENVKLFFRSSNPNLLKEKRIISIVGSRKCSQYGINVCRKIIPLLKHYPLVIASGLAYGIDQCAHEIALENGIKTLGIIGSSLEDRYIYPRRNEELAKNILLNDGMLISQFAHNHHPRREDFINRNFVIAAFSELIIVVEAKEKSGALWTAYFGSELNRNVGAIPGEIESETSKGANNLIKEGAYLISSSEDILEILKLPYY